MNHSNQIEIPLNKIRLVAFLFGAVATATIGLFFINNGINNFHVFHDPIIGWALGIFYLLLPVKLALLVIERLRDKRPGLIISQEGITDNSSLVSVGFIPWADVLKINENIGPAQPFIKISVKNPQQYIDRKEGICKRKVLWRAYKHYYKGIGISTFSLRCDFFELKTMLAQGLSDFEEREYMQSLIR